MAISISEQLFIHLLIATGGLNNGPDSESVSQEILKCRKISPLTRSSSLIRVRSEVEEFFGNMQSSGKLQLHHCHEE